MKNTLKLKRKNDLANRLNEERLIRGDKRFVQPPSVGRLPVLLEGPLDTPAGGWAWARVANWDLIYPESNRLMPLWTQVMILVDSIDEDHIYPEGSAWSSLLSKIDINFTYAFPTADVPSGSSLAYIVIKNNDVVAHDFYVFFGGRAFEVTSTN